LGKTGGFGAHGATVLRRAFCGAGVGGRASLERITVDRAQKQQLTATLHEDLSDTVCVVVTHQTGLSVAEVTDLRRQMRSAGARYRVTKNRLVLRALEGTPFAALAPLFTGPTAIAFSQDPVAAAKAAVNYANRNTKLTIIGGGLSGQTLDPAGIRALATLPSLDELRGKIIGLLNAPATKLAVLLQTPGGQLARVLAAYSEKDGAAPAGGEHSEGAAEPAAEAGGAA
jgi:large subunit ribosomal protein L10